MRKTTCALAAIALGASAAFALDGGQVPDGFTYDLEQRVRFRVSGARARLLPRSERSGGGRAPDVLAFRAGSAYAFEQRGANEGDDDGTYVETRTDVIELTPSASFLAGEEAAAVASFRDRGLLPPEDGVVDTALAVDVKPVRLRRGLRTLRGRQTLLFTADEGGATTFRVVLRVAFRGKLRTL
jgi:hypothetical protein